MTDPSDHVRLRLAALSGRTRRMLDYVAVLEGGARYEVLRRLARVTEEDLIGDLREAVDGGILAAMAGQPNLYDFTDEAVREVVLADAGVDRLPKLRARANAARLR